MSELPRRLLLAAIRGYQRFVSPYKGFRCAYRVHTGNASCSALGYRAVRRHGVFTGLGLLRQRTARCSIAYRRFAVSMRATAIGQRGFVDCACDIPSCDLAGLDCLTCGGDCMSCGDCDACDACDWRRRKHEDAPPGEQQVYLPVRDQEGRARRVTSG